MSAPTLTLPNWALSEPILAAIECHVKGVIRHTPSALFPTMAAVDAKLLADIETMKEFLRTRFEPAKPTKEVA